MNDCSQPREEASGDAIAGHVREILRLMGEDPSREGLLKTPERVQKAFQFLLQGNSQNPDDIVGDRKSVV